MGTEIVERPTDREAKRLSSLIAIIDRAVGSCFEAGEALAAIHSERLWRFSHGSFDEFCRARWGFVQSRAYNLMKSAEVKSNLQEAGISHDLFPKTEYQARALAAVKPEVRAETWMRAIDANGGRLPSGQQMYEQIRGRSDRPTKPKTIPLGPPSENFADMVRSRKFDGKLRHRDHETRKAMIKRLADRLPVLHEYGDWEGYLRTLVEIGAIVRDIAITEDLVTTE